MRIKTFLATYLLFVLIFFISQAVVSIHMTNSQFAFLREKSEAEFRSIAASLTKDIAVLSGRDMSISDFEESVSSLATGYERYYQNNKTTLQLENVSDITTDTQIDLSFGVDGQNHFLSISGTLSGHFQFYRLHYSSDITQNVAELSRVQNILLLLTVIFSVIAAVALHIILSKIFKPLGIVSEASRKIADGHYSERIKIKGHNEPSSMAENFNRMAVEIEKQIHLLEDEAAQKQQFADNFAHEIRTPLTSIYGYAEYMQKARLSEEEVIESAQLILNEAGYMRKISDSLLELAALRRYSSEEQWVSLPRLIDGVSQSLTGLMRAKRAKLVCVCGANMISGQEDLLRSLLLNLGVNAIKACPESGGIIRIEAAEEGGHVILSVADNGCGIPEENIERITEPFYRVDKARSRETGGVGLGLAICRQIAAAHNAEMQIKSAPGRGTKIEVIFTTS
ncbi:MAG: HAMP domain-containing histidine kinase [Clostridiales bacterium]|jgi:signal transduction histidine kinase|nr:HAMP domain-containing histidine kinase [Clostridiales bacterium]